MRWRAGRDAHAAAKADGEVAATALTPETIDYELTRS
jgi:hypothetical protein